MKDWKWNEGRYGVQKGLREIVDALNKVRLTGSLLAVRLLTEPVKEMSSIDNAMKAKLANYNLVKGSLVQMQRKKTFVIAYSDDLPNC
jgi:V-type H+-transporting ATPase subunit C